MTFTRKCLPNDANRAIGGILHGNTDDRCGDESQLRRKGHIARRTVKLL